jgi:hypothetical protein
MVSKISPSTRQRPNLTASRQRIEGSVVGGGGTDGSVGGPKTKEESYKVGWLPYGVSPELRNKAANNIVKFAR